MMQIEIIEKIWIEFLKFLEIIKWPILIIVVSFLLKNKLSKIFDYLFLSLRDFNFFGFRGELEDPKKLINKKARELYNQEEKEKQIEILKKGVIELIDDKGKSEQRISNLTKLTDLQEQIINRQDELLKEVKKYERE